MASKKKKKKKKRCFCIPKITSTCTQPVFDFSISEAVPNQILDTIDRSKSASRQCIIPIKQNQAGITRIYRYVSTNSCRHKLIGNNP